MEPPHTDDRHAQSRSLIIAGSRSLDQPLITDHLVEDGRRAVARAVACVAPFSREDVAEVVSGTAAGPDQWGEAWGEATPGVSVVRMPADWDRHGRSAGPKRNMRMAEYADTLLAFYDGDSSGTDHMITTATDRGLDVTVVDMSTPAKRKLIVAGEKQPAVSD